MRVIVFGAGARTGQIFEDLKSDIEIIAIVDNDKKKWGSVIGGVLIHSPEYVKEAEYDYIFIVPVNYYEIQRQLEKMGVKKECIANSTHIELVCQEISVKEFATELYNEENSIVAFSHALTSTGAQNVLVTALIEYKKMGYDVTVISPADGELRGYLQEKGVRIFLIRDFYTQKKRINEWMKKARLVIVNTLWLHHVILDISDTFENLVWWIHESMNVEFMDYAVFEKCAEHNIAVYAVSELVRKEILTIIPVEMKIKILRFGLEEYEIENKNHDKIRFVVLAAMAYIKGQDVLIQAVESMSKEWRERAEFYLIGGGRRTETLLNSAKKAGVIVLDQVDHAEIARVYEMTDVLVCPSRKESMSVAVAEAMMHAKPSIVSDAAGISAYIDNYNEGIIFKSGNSAELKKAVEWMIENRDKLPSMGNAARKIYEQKFAMDVHRVNLKKLLEDI